MRARDNQLEQEAERAGSQAAASKPSATAHQTAAHEGSRSPRPASNELPEAARDGIDSPGRPLDSDTRSEMESGLGHDFSRVRVHTGDRAAASAHALRAKAFTSGDHVVFGQDRYAPTSTEGKELLAHELTHVAQHNHHDHVPAVQRAPLDEIAAEESSTEAVGEVDSAKKTDSELVTGIIGAQLGILTGWETALDNFDKVLSSESAKSSKPDFRKVFMTFFQDQLMGEMISRSKVKGAGDAFGLLGKIEAETARAAAARESVALRDFFVQHRTAIGSVRQQVEAIEDDFQASVRITEETAERSGDWDAYGLQRLHLVEMLERLDFRLMLSTPQDLFKKLSEEWIRQQRVPGALGTSTPALIVIHINHDFSIRKAEIKGSGGQKIAEQLLIDSPEGVDVFGMKVPRRVLYYKAGKSLHSAIVRLDANGRNINDGAFIEGTWRPIANVLKANGLPPTTKLSGD